MPVTLSVAAVASGPNREPLVSITRAGTTRGDQAPPHRTTIFRFDRLVKLVLFELAVAGAPLGISNELRQALSN